MLIVALVLAVVSLAALVTAVVTSNEVIAWVCIGLSALGVLLLIIDAIRDRQHKAPSPRRSDRTEVIAPVDATEVIEPVDQPDDASLDDVPAESDAEDGVPPEAGEAPFAEQQETLAEEIAVEDFPDEVVDDDPDSDLPSDDEPSYPLPAEEAAIHTVTEDDIAAEDAEDGAYSEPETVVDSDEPTYTVTYADVPPADASTTVIYSSEADPAEADESGDGRKDR
ncbi:MAG: hypothetical protein U0R66_13105 [Mycobacterium sp.]